MFTYTNYLSMPSLSTLSELSKQVMALSNSLVLLKDFMEKTSDKFEAEARRKEGELRTLSSVGSQS